MIEKKELFFGRRKEAAKESAAEQKTNLKINPNISFSVTEAYKALRTNINFTIPGDGCKSFLITSAVLSEGKTTTSSSLALTITQTDASVVLVDTDMRRPKVHTKFSMVNQVGLSNLLVGMCTLEEAIQQVEEAPGLYVIPSGTLPPNPAELLASPAMEALVAELKKRFDYVILDTPPVDIVADALPLSRLVDGVVLVVRYHQSMHPEVAAAVERLEFAGARILGFVLNGV
ncbi:MAG: CpsD/CapB family tyrosine-protein kinase, partial [Clostridia bacterium]|nr:CpsD/CapB family tyrosine-protein kinase [Clostridia bacterium]